jgi:hypothetical protein
MQRECSGVFERFFVVARANEFDSLLETAQITLGVTVTCFVGLTWFQTPNLTVMSCNNVAVCIEILHTDSPVV